MKNSKYIIVFVNYDGHWDNEFSAFDKEEIAYEIDALRQSGIKAKNIKKVTIPNASQVEVEKAIAAINS